MEARLNLNNYRHYLSWNDGRVLARTVKWLNKAPLTGMAISYGIIAIFISLFFHWGSGPRKISPMQPSKVGRAPRTMPYMPTSYC